MRRDDWPIATCASAIKQEPGLRNATAVSLSPFDSTVANLPLCSRIRELFNYTCSTLRRLVVDIPLSNLGPDFHRAAICGVLREGFERLQNLEECVSTRDDLWLDPTVNSSLPEVWTSWKKLKRLALSNVTLTPRFFQNLAHLPALEALVLPYSGGSGDTLDAWAEYFKHTARPLKLIMLSSQRRALVPDRLLCGRVKNRAEVADVPMIRSIWLQHTLKLSETECQDLVRSHAEDGTLWDLDHGTIPCNARPYIDEPYLAVLGQHWLMVDERRRAWALESRTYSSRRGPTHSAFFERYMAGLLEYQQYDTLELLRSSAQSCLLCRKMYFRFTGTVIEDIRMDCRNDSTLMDGVAPDKRGPIRIWFEASPNEASESLFEVNRDHLGFGFSSDDPSFYGYGVRGPVYSSKFQFFVIPEDHFDLPKVYEPVQPTDDHLLSKHTIEFAKQCISHCSRNHMVCSSSASLPLWIIEIDDQGLLARLVPGCGTVAKYVTLSYKWGGYGRYSLKRDNKTSLQEQIPLNEIPKTFAHAIKLTRRLGYTYLWIDALCITQDDPEELHKQINLMQDIYSGSDLTLFAATGDDANAGLKMSHNVSLVYPLQITLTHGVTKASKAFWIADFIGWKPLRYQDNFEHRPLFQRGWVLQELLSRRSLLFGAKYVTWQCLSEVLSEALPFHEKRLGRLNSQDQVDFLRHDDGLTETRMWIWGLKKFDDDNGDEEVRKEEERFFALNELYGVIQHYATHFHQGMYLGDYRAFLWQRQYEHEEVTSCRYPSWSWISCYGDTLKFEVRLHSPTPRPDCTWQLAYRKDSQTVEKLTVTTWSQWITFKAFHDNVGRNDIRWGARGIVLLNEDADTETSHLGSLFINLDAASYYTGLDRRALYVFVARFDERNYALLLEPSAEGANHFRRIGLATPFGTHKPNGTGVLRKPEMSEAVMESERKGDGLQVTTLYLV
ncbi:hypothetical protein OPT61_g8841 [Boeremia exigua]|uniref:Uncharacterized protein n=1 Tax=Boeremia exigua TaxID=749465 RepID=A0ACC2HXG9_9PLEO|nr:hypothetical protein OPT61_g8841 [Boeremia exigua]